MIHKNASRGFDPLENARLKSLLIILGLIVVGTSFQVVGQLPITVSEETKADIYHNYGKIPLSFEENRGQTNRKVRFVSRGAGYELFLTPNETVFKMRNGINSNPSKHLPGSLVKSRSKSDRQNWSVLRMRFIGANPNPGMVGLDELSGRSSYFRGTDPGKWQINVPTYRRVKYRGIYPGVDTVYYGNQQELEYDLVVAPRVDPNVIKFAIEGNWKLRINESGHLMLRNGQLVAQMQKPIIYQEIGGVRRHVQGGYVLRGSHQVGFRIGDYDRNYPLTIDPVFLYMAYGTFIGGSGDDDGYGITVDEFGNAYIAGSTFSLDFPSSAGSSQIGSNGGEECFVTKLNASGSARVYSTYLGGNDLDRCQGIGVDGVGNAYVTGYTLSTNFPVTPAAFQTIKRGVYSAFVTKLNAEGSALEYSSYLGGSLGNGDAYNYGRGIAVDRVGNAFVTGQTTARNFPTTAGAVQTTHGGQSDAFLTKVNPVGTALIYSTYLGGNDFFIGNGEIGYGVAIDDSGAAYVTGHASSENFPITAGVVQRIKSGVVGAFVEDAFVTKINAAGSALVYSTFVGGSSVDVGRSIAVDTSGNAYITGNSFSIDFPTTPGAFQTSSINNEQRCDAFVTKLNANGSSLVYSTYLGKSEFEFGYGIAIDQTGNAYVIGRTDSNNFPTTPGAFQPIFQRSFLTEFDPAGSLIYSTFLTGVIGYGINVDGQENIYITGYTTGNLPATAGSAQSVSGGGKDAFVAKLSRVVDLVAPTASPTQANAANGAGWNNQDVTVEWNWLDNVGGQGIDSINCTASSVSTGEGNSINLNATCQDLAGNIGNASYVVKVDKTKPTIAAAATASPNAHGWYNSNVNVHYTCLDADSGILAGGCPLDETLDTEGTAVGSSALTVVDAAGNMSDASNVVTVQIDKTAPTISITSPTSGSYVLNQAATVSFSCSDNVSGIASCTGSAADGSALDTSSTGSKSVTVTAVDKAGNTSSTTVNYTVGYGVQALYDATRAHKSGSTIPIKIQLVDANGVNVSSPSLLPHAIGVIQTSSQASTEFGDAGNSNPDFDFRYDAGLAGYIFNLQTTGMGTGSYLLNFIAGSPQPVYSVGFQIRQ